jgi:hypothetical protein
MNRTIQELIREQLKKVAAIQCDGCDFADNALTADLTILQSRGTCKVSTADEICQKHREAAEEMFYQCSLLSNLAVLDTLWLMKSHLYLTARVTVTLDMTCKEAR